MEAKNLSALSDEELLQEAKKARTSAIIHAGFIGFLIGIVVYSVAKQSWGYLTLILAYFAFRLFRRSNQDTRELDRILKERNLK